MHKATLPGSHPSLCLTAHGGAAAAMVSVPSILPPHLPKATNPIKTTAERALQPLHSQPSMQVKVPSILVC